MPKLFRKSIFFRFEKVLLLALLLGGFIFVRQSDFGLRSRDVLSARMDVNGVQTYSLNGQVYVGARQEGGLGLRSAHFNPGAYARKAGEKEGFLMEGESQAGATSRYLWGASVIVVVASVLVLGLFLFKYSQTKNG